MKALVYNFEGKQTGEVELPAKLFEVPVNVGLVHEALRVIDSESRAPLAHTKTRGEVRGGGRKPWKQKGTGRARHGSIRSPIWKGGGVVFGPRKERNFVIAMNRKARQKALFMCLSDKATTEHIVFLENIPEKVKTKEVGTLLKQLPLKGKKTLIALATDEKGMRLFVRNLKSVGVIGAANLNVKDLLAHANLVLSKKALVELQKTYNV